MFTPEVNEIYPHGAERATRVEVARVVAHPGRRVPPGPFRGRQHRVAKLFHIVEPDVAVFGDKGFSAADHHPAHGRGPVHAGRDRRRTHGARFRRPRHELAQPVLTADERALAPKIYATLQAAANRMRSGDVDFASIEHSGLQALESAGFRLDYFCVRQAADLGTPRPQHVNWSCSPACA